MLFYVFFLGFRIYLFWNFSGNFWFHLRLNIIFTSNFIIFIFGDNILFYGLSNSFFGDATSAI
jgi:hypothetical protein